MSQEKNSKQDNEQTKYHDESLEPVSPYTIMAKLFAHVSKAVVDRFGEEGREAVREGVRTFGEERGRDIARRAAADGQPNDIENYLTHYDMGRSDLFEYETQYHPMEIEQNFTKCAFGDQWKKDGMEEYGILYCQMIDPAIAKGYNPNFEVVHDDYLLREGNCHFRFQMKNPAESKTKDTENK
ncbi:L-2-amino-thiazoline-4-carboxylic acid hydrolase [Paenibacillus kribbensis]|uniref:L-2-amino-thiazoline-4-carboxylic acid hydrolase n=1 Tax=Paenibacillus kribbensis TaxID=172713 RepID=UPI002DBC27A2|nr:L-2-amino-thiazoline-4-carboxylic acid hydrolase [Paenibacillus kribbensis]MEC0237827.1 L-2-amino-thiazoline-4-carboxylic acid hydrolase [Paenibacillus kribbensis]